jgi:hypothetical protein
MRELVVVSAAELAQRPAREHLLVVPEQEAPESVAPEPVAVSAAELAQRPAREQLPAVLGPVPAEFSAAATFPELRSPTRLRFPNSKKATCKVYCVCWCNSAKRNKQKLRSKMRPCGSSA